MAARSISSWSLFTRLSVCAVLCAVIIAVATCAPGGLPASSFTSPLPTPRVTPPISPLPTPTPMPQEGLGVSITTVQATRGAPTTLTVRAHSPVTIDGASLSVTLDGPNGVVSGPFRQMNLRAGVPQSTEFPLTFDVDGDYWILVNLITPNGRVAGTSVLLRIAQGDTIVDPPPLYGPGTPVPAAPAGSHNPADLARLAARNMARSAPQAPSDTTVTLHGFTSFYERLDYWEPGFFFYVEVYDWEGDNPDQQRLLGTAHADLGGSFHVGPIENTDLDGSRIDPYYVFCTSGNPTQFDIRVQYSTGTNYCWTTRAFHQWDIGFGDQNLSPAEVNGTTPNHEAAWLWLDALMASSYVANGGSSLGPVTIKWQAGWNSMGLCGGSCYLPIAPPNAVFVAQQSVGSRDTAVHEIGHRYRHNRMGTWFFADAPAYLACLQHGIMDVMPNGQCALNEGFADYFALAVNSQWHMEDWCYDFTTPGPCDPAPGQSIDLEHQWFTDGHPEGDLVEGRVAGSVYDLTDPWPDFLDQQQDSFDFVAADIGSGSTPHDFFQNWGGQSANCVFYNNTIDYGGCTVYRTYLPSIMNQ